MNKKTFILVFAALIAGPALAADPAAINWSKIPTVKVPLFYPGQSSYEWLRSDAHKGAVKEVTRGDACTKCHDEPDEERDIGNKLVKGGRLEPMPVKGKNGFVELSVQVAYDTRNAYFRYQWKSNGKAGIEYPYYRFDGKDWKVYGGPRLDKAVQDGKQPPIYEDRLSMMLDDGTVPGFAQQGCWLTCHDGEPLTAERAEAWGLIWKCVDDDKLADETGALAAKFAAAPTKGLALIKDAGHFAAFTQPKRFLAELLVRVHPLASPPSPSSMREP